MANRNKPREWIYFIPDLLKPNPAGKLEKVKADDPFLSIKTIERYCPQFLGTPEKAMGYSASDITSFGKDFFEGVAELQNGRMQKYIEEDREEEALKEQSQKEEMVAKKKLDEKVEKVFKQHRVFVKRSCPVKIPYKSGLNHEEHELYLAAFLKYQGKTPKTSLEHLEYQKYMSLQNRVFEEQHSLMEFSKKVAEKRLSDYNAVPPAIEEFVTRYLKHGFSRVLQYPRLYHLEQEIPLRPYDQHNLYSGLTLDHKGHLLSLGVVPWIKLPYPNCKINFPVTEDFLKHHPPELLLQPKHNLSSSLDGTFLNKTTVSEDPNCSYLAGQHRACVVLTPSAVKVLLNNPPPNFDKEWDIPVIIRNIPVTESDGSTSQQRVVFIEKPIKRKLWTPLEKKALYFKKVARSTITQYRKGILFRMKPPALFHYTDCSSSSTGNIGQSYGPSVCEDAEGSASTRRYDSLSNEGSPSPARRNNLSSSSMGRSPQAQDRRSYMKKNFVPFVSSRDGSMYEESSFDDPFGVAEVNAMAADMEEFGMERSSAPSRKRVKEVEESVMMSALEEKKKMKGSSQSRSEAEPGKDGNGVRKSGSSEDKLAIAEEGKVSPAEQSKVDATQQCKTTSSSSGGSVLDVLLDGQTSMFSSSSAAPQVTRGTGKRMGEQSTEDTQPVQENRSPWTNRLTTDWSGHTHARNPTPGTTVNYHYQLFQFHTPSNQGGAAVGVAALPPLNLLVRSHLHGLSMENVNRKGKTFKSSAYVVHPKLENQVFFGCEVNTQTEVMQQWTDLLLRPNTRVLQTRVCSVDGDMVLSQERDLSEVVREGHQQHIKFQPSACLASLYSVLHSLRSRPPGHYLLHHHNKSEAFIRLMRAVDEDQIHSGHQFMFDLHASYGYKKPSHQQQQHGSSEISGSQADVNVIDSRQYLQPPWLAIDTHVPTPFHLKHRKIPATFPMDNPDKKLTKSRKRQIQERAKQKASIFDTPDEARKQPERPPQDDRF